MNDYTRKLLDKAIDTIESAELLLDHGKPMLPLVGRTMLCFISPKPC